MTDIILTELDIEILTKLIRYSTRDRDLNGGGWARVADCISGDSGQTSHRLLKMCKAGYVETDRDLKSISKSNRWYRPTNKGRLRLRIHREIHGE